MALSQLLDQYMDPLLSGRRNICREMVKTAIDKGIQPQALYSDLIWPAMERVDQLYREDRINRASEHMAVRINRTVADHLQTRLPRKPAIDKRILITCANDEPEEFSAQMVSDIFEANGWEVFFVGGGIPRDEVGELVGKLQPHVLLIFGSKPSDAPLVRDMIDYIREVNACPGLNIMVSGGVFNRASGLWQEVKADLYAESASEAVELAEMAEPRFEEARVRPEDGLRPPHRRRARGRLARPLRLRLVRGRGGRTRRRLAHGLDDGLPQRDPPPPGRRHDRDRPHQPQRG